MIYNVFNSKNERIQEIHDANWPMIKKGEKIPLVIDGREGLYKVVKVGDVTIRDNKLVWDIWVV